MRTGRGWARSDNHLCMQHKGQGGGTTPDAFTGQGTGHRRCHGNPHRNPFPNPCCCHKAITIYSSDTRVTGRTSFDKDTDASIREHATNPRPALHVPFPLPSCAAPVCPDAITIYLSQAKDHGLTLYRCRSVSRVQWSLAVQSRQWNRWSSQGVTPSAAMRAARCCSRMR